MATYQPQGRLKTFFHRDAALFDEVIFTGPACTGKTRACLEYMNAACRKVPGLRAAVVRDSLQSLSNSEMVTFEMNVKGGDVRFKRFPYPHYVYPNGSTLRVITPETPLRNLRERFHLIYVAQVTELTESEWAHFVSRADQIIGDCNPAEHDHWIMERFWQSDDLMIVNTTHKDNPLLFDERLNDYTAYGNLHRTMLSRLTGTPYQRLFLGRWASKVGTTMTTTTAERVMPEAPAVETKPAAATSPVLAELMWAFHNLIAHPVSELLYWVNMLFRLVAFLITFAGKQIAGAGNWLHEISVPVHEPGKGRG